MLISTPNYWVQRKKANSTSIIRARTTKTGTKENTHSTKLYNLLPLLLVPDERRCFSVGEHGREDCSRAYPSSAQMQDKAMRVLKRPTMAAQVSSSARPRWRAPSMESELPAALEELLHRRSAGVGRVAALGGALLFCPLLDGKALY